MRVCRAFLALLLVPASAGFGATLALNCTLSFNNQVREKL